MKMQFNVLLFLCLGLLTIQPLTAQNSNREFYELRFYRYTGDSSESRLDNYFKQALVPALHRAGINKVGVFKSSYHDTASVRNFVLLIPYKSLSMLDKLEETLAKDKQYLAAGSEYINAAYNDVPFKRIQKIILKAFPKAPSAQKANLSGDLKERVYELRSYEGPTEKLYHTKVKMFNTGDEIGIFQRLGFNAVFYGEVLAGSSMPNLMYMTSFNDMASRESHWKAFGSDPAWDKLKSDKQYDNTVSHMDVWFLSPLSYSDF